MDVDRNVNGQGNVANGNQVGVDGGSDTPIVRSSTSRIQSKSINQNVEDKSLEQHDVSEGNNSSATKLLPNNACGNNGNQETEKSKFPTKDAFGDTGDQQGVMEKQNSVVPSQPVAEKSIYTVDDAIRKLYECFKSPESINIPCLRTFDFKRFAEVNKISLNDSYIPHSDVVKNSFLCMYNVTYELLSKDVTFKKEDGEDIPIKLTPDEILGIINTLGNVPDEDKAYKLYGELGVIIFSKMNSAVQNTNKEALGKSLWANYYICKSILSLPLVNCNGGIKFCTMVMDSILIGKHSVFELSEPKLSDAERADSKHQNLVNDFKKLGMFFAFKNDKLGEKLLLAAQFATSIGMKMPLFMAEVTTEDKEFRPSGFSSDVVGVAVHDAVLSEKDFKGFPWVCYNFYHEITHHARSAVGALYADKSIAGKSLESKELALKDNTNLINAIKSQIMEYALTNSEEYIADFSALVLCCLEHNKNPFSYIDDARLWRLYYEFGGPDYAPIIHEKFYKSAGVYNILEDPNYGYCSGYPSKFGIDVDKLSNEKIWVREISSPDGLRFISVTSKTILPPPPIGYCYTTERGCIGLKIDKNMLPGGDDSKYYTPLFCSLTNGPLTLLCAGQFQLEHHLELFPKESGGVSQSIDSAALSSANKQIIAQYQQLVRP